MTGYVLYLCFETQTLEYPLYMVEDTHISLSLFRIGIEAYIDLTVWDGSWLLEENKYFDIYIRDKETGKPRVVSETAIRDNGYVLFKAKDGSVHFTVLSVATTKEYTTYAKYLMPNSGVVTIGSSPSNIVHIPSNMINPKHCEIVVKDGKVGIKDCDTKFGTFVNGIKVTKPILLNPLDTITMQGYKIVYLGSVLAVNYPNKIKCKLSALTSLNTMDASEVEPVSDVFNRAPRLIQPFDEDKVVLETPPHKKEKDDMPPIFTYGPSMTMPIPMITAMMINMQVRGSGSSMYIGMLCSMLLSMGLSIMWSTLRRRYNAKKDIRDEEFRVSQYKHYVEQNVELIMEKETFNKSVLESQFLATDKLLLCLNGHQELIWNRNVNHSDFLTIRLGVGMRKNFNEVTGPENKFSLTNDDLLELPHQVVAEHKFLMDIPATIDLKDADSRIIGVIGEYEQVHTISQNILLQVAALHTYADIKICVLYNEDEGSLYDWVRWLPHTFDKDKKIRFVGGTRASHESVINYIIHDLDARKTAFEESNSDKISFPYHYIVLVTSDKIFEGNQLGQLITTNADLGATFILAFSNMNGIPNECKTLIECSSDFQGYYKLTEARDETAVVNFDNIPVAMPEWFSRRISGLGIKEITSGDIPSAVTFLNMLGIGRLEHWDLQKKYRENHAYEHIRAQLGIGVSGKQVFLDLHEKRHGPHGLVAGTTGSGKSETLQTAILSWMLNYSPDEVAFVLIDYKGGGMANLFTGVPHLAGTITNISDDEETSANADEPSEEEEETVLDDSQTRRALISLKSEIKYRQGLFRAFKVNHIDGYMRLFRKGEAQIPLPHLIIISDEFAELKKEQPEFIKELVSAARVGRSLGVHLILATQKPSNSVDDEIWANSRFKICLRVQDRADSTSMLKRPEAASITRTGRGYFQLGNNEIFEEFQSGWSGADYEPQDKIVSPEDSVCTMIELDGTETQINVERKVRDDDVLTQLEACIKFIIQQSSVLGLQTARQLWPPQLPKKLYLDDIATKEINFKTTLTGIFGLIDDPERQVQYPVSFNFMNISNLRVVGAPGVGKSTLLQTMLLSLVSNYTPEEVNLYIADFSSNALRFFNNLPHVGGYIVESDALEKVQRLFQLLQRVIAERKQLFAQENVSNFVEYRRKHTIPGIIVVIDNWAKFIECYGDGIIDDFIILTRDGMKFGIQFVFAISKTNDIKSKLSSNILNGICLSMPEKIDYREVLGVSPVFLPPAYRGRGLCIVGKRVLEYHTALPEKGVSEADRNELLVQRLQSIGLNNEQYTRALEIPLIPKDERYNTFFAKASKSKGIPLGYNVVDISKIYLSLYEWYCLSLSDSTLDCKGISMCMSNLLYAFKQMNYDIHIIKLNRKVMLSSVGDVPVLTTDVDIANFLYDLEDECFLRVKEGKALKLANKSAEYIDRLSTEKRLKFVFIDSLPALCTLLAGAAVKPIDEERNKKRSAFNAMENRIAAMFKQGSEYGVYFVAGFPNADTDVAATRETTFKEFTSYETAIHMGGAVSSVKTFKYVGSNAVGSKILPITDAKLCWCGVQTDIFIPEEE